MTKVELISNDNETVKTELEVAEYSGTIKDLIGIYNKDENRDEFKIPLNNVSGRILRLVVEWSQHHKEINSPTEECKSDRTDDIDRWDMDFLKPMDQSTLFELILAANYLNTKGLLDVTCKTVANMIKGKTAEEVRTIFKIQNDFTPQEEEQIRLENQWCEER